MSNAFAMIDEAIWRKDRDFRALSRYAQCTFLQILSQRDVDCAGVLTLHVGLLAKGCDEITADDIWGDLVQLEGARFVYFDTGTDELLIRSYIRRVAARSPNILKAAFKAARAVSSPKLRSILAAELRRLNRVEAAATADEIDTGWNPSGTIPEPLPNPSERGNPSRTLPEPPICSSVVAVAVTPVGGYVEEARARADPRDEAQPGTDPPARYCRRHMPGGTADPCGDCRAQRAIFDRWLTHADIATKAAHQAQARAEAAQRTQHVNDAAQAIADCGLCGDDGYRGTRVCDHADHADAARRGRALVDAALTRRPPVPADPDEPLF